MGPPDPPGEGGGILDPGWVGPGPTPLFPSASKEAGFLRFTDSFVEACASIDVAVTSINLERMVDALPKRSAVPVFPPLVFDKHNNSTFRTAFQFCLYVLFALTILHHYFITRHKKVNPTVPGNNFIFDLFHKKESIAFYWIPQCLFLLF